MVFSLLPTAVLAADGEDPDNTTTGSGQVTQKNSEDLGDQSEQNGLNDSEDSDGSDAPAEVADGGEWTTVTLSESGKLEDAVKEVNSDLDTITKLKVTTSDDAVLLPADFQFLSGVVVTETEDGRYRSEYAGSGTTYLRNLAELDLSGARCENNAIPPRAFQRNTTITKIILPDTLECTYLHAFSMMNALTYLGTAAGNLIFPSSMKIMGEGMVYQDAKLSGSLTLPASLEAIGSSCFYQSGITGDVVIPGNVNIVTNTDINSGEYNPSASIFNGTRISSLTFEDGITKISNSFAYGCESLTSVTIPASVKTIGEDAFHGTSLTAYPEMAGVTEVGNSAFRDLKSVITGDIELKSDVSYGDRVFLGDKINGNVTVNSNDVGTHVFERTVISGSLTINSKMVPSSALLNSAINGDITVNSSSIDVNAFKDVAINGDLTIKSETVPSNLLSQSDADYNNGKARITGTGNVTLGDGVKEVGDGAFNYAAIPGTLTLPEGLEKIGGSAFRKNKLHDNIVIPESVTKIGIAAFSYAGNAENVLNFIVESADPASTLSKYAFFGQASGTKIYFMTAVENKDDYWSGNVVTILNTDGGYVDTTKVDSTTGLFTPSKAGYSFLGWFDGNTKLENTAAAGKTYYAKWIEHIPEGPTEFGDEQLAGMQVNVQCETDTAHAKIYHFGELDGCYSTSDITTDGNGGYYVTVTLTRAAVVTKFNGEDDSINGGKTHEDTAPNASTSWTWTWNASEKTWKMDNAPMTNAWATIVVKCNGSQPEVKPTPPTVEQLLGGFVIKCVSSGKHNLDAASLGLSVALKSVSEVGTYEVVSTEATKGTDGRYYVEVKVNNVDAYLPQYEQAVSNIEHERNDGVSNELTLTYYYNEETKAWAQDSEPVVDVKCKNTQPTKPDASTLSDAAGGVTFECENPDKTHTVFYSITYTIQAKDYTFISDVQYDDETKQYYVLANVTLDSEYYLELFDGWTGATHRISDGQSLTLTGIRFNYNKVGEIESQNWKQELPKPVIRVTCAEELFPVKLVIYRNGDTSKAYKTVSLESRPKDYVIEPTTINIADYYTANYTGQYDFDGWYDDGAWNEYKKNPERAGLDSITVNGWTNIICMVYDYENVVYYMSDADRVADNRLFATTARKGAALPTADAPTATRDGYTFQYWSREGQTGDVTGQTVNGWTNLYANWEKIPTPDVSEIDFTGKKIYVKCDIYGDEHGELIDYIPGTYEIRWDGVSPRANLVFKAQSYLDASKFANDHVLTNAAQTEVSTQIVFEKGQWTQKTNGPTVWVSCQATLTYDANAPEGKPVTNMPDPLKVTQTLNAGSTTTFYLSENIPACEGYVFLGWTSDTTLDVPTIPVEWKTENNGANWKTTTGYPGYTLYAVWQKLTPVYAYMQPTHKGTALTSKDEKITAALKDLGFEEGFNQGKKFVTIGKTETDKTDLNDVSKQVTDEIDNGTFATYEKVHATTAVQAKIDWNELKLVDDAEHKGYTDDGKIEGYHLNGTLSFCDVQFKPNGDNVKNMPADVYHLQYTDIALATPTREGYTFKGWSVQEDKPTVLDASNGAGTLVTDSYYIGNDTIFTAQWEAEIYTITYEYNDKDIKHKTQLQPKNPNSYTIEDAITLKPIEAAGEHGKQFVEWRCDLNKDGVAETITKIPKGTTGNLTISAHWNYPVNYTVFDKNGDKIDRLSKTVYVFEEDFEEDGYKLKALTQDGYTFDGWYQDDDDLGKTEKLIKDQTLKTAKKWELYGKLTPKEYTVTFDPNAEGASVDPTSQLVTFDAAYGELPTPTREGYTFEGWYLSKTEFTPANKVEATTIVKTPGDHMLYANWAANTYTVTFNPNADDATVAPTSQLVTFDAAYGELPTPTRENYRFVGWYLSGVIVTKDTIVKTAANHTLLAGWSRSYYALTINYVDRNGKKLEKSYEASVALGADFSVTSPDVKGYKLRDKDDAVIEGTMTAAGYTYDVVYVKKSSGGSSVQIESPNKPKQDNSLKFNTEDHFAYVNGYPDGTVKPTGDVTRAEVAAILYRVMDADCVKTYETTRCSFSDVVRGDWFNLYVATLENADVIVDTRTNGKFRPNEAITRAELAAMLAQFADIKSAANSFNDVSARHWASDEIAVCAKMGWINGYPDGSFRPDATITRAEMMAMINRALGRTPKSADDLLSGMKTWRDNANVNAWYYLDVQEATNSHTYTKSGSHETWKKLR